MKNLLKLIKGQKFQSSSWCECESCGKQLPESQAIIIPTADHCQDVAVIYCLKCAERMVNY